MKRYEIAGLKVDMEVFGQTKIRAAAYEIPASGPADITFTCDAGRVLALNPELENLDNALYMGTGAYFARELLRFQGTFLHASAVVLEGKAYLFSAPSGTGKSTHTEKWCRLFDAHYLNDDKPALRLVNGLWTAYGTPWSGKHDLSSPESAPVGGIAFLMRGQENTIAPITPRQALPRFMSQSLMKLNKSQMESQLSLIDSLLCSVPLWELTCRDDDEAAKVAYSVMAGGAGACE